jgi:hypothetical protein
MICALPLLVPTAAVTFAAPFAQPVTTPVGETLAIAVSELDHESETPVTILPCWSQTFAMSVTDWPTASVSFTGETVTDAGWKTCRARSNVGTARLARVAVGTSEQASKTMVPNANARTRCCLRMRIQISPMEYQEVGSTGLAHDSSGER